MATYQVWAAPIYDTLAHFQAFGQFFGGGFTTLGWVAQSGHGEIVASGSGASYAWTSPVLPTTALLSPNSYTFKGAFVPSTTYVGGNSAALTTECDVVTSAGITYVHITATSSLATVPASDTTNWQPLQFEIWKSNGTNTASLPIFIKIVYTLTTTANTGPRTIISVGTGVDSNGNITNALTLGGSPTSIISTSGSATGSSLLGEQDMSGDADNVRFLLNRGAPTGTSSINWLAIMVIDRAKNSVGVDTDAHFYYGSLMGNNGAQNAVSGLMFNSALGSSFNVNVTTPWMGATAGGGGTTSMAVFGSAPVFPVYPTPGYLANPCLGVIGIHRADYANADGSIIPVWMYGAVHSYLVSSQLSAAAASIDGSPANGGVYPAILWE